EVGPLAAEEVLHVLVAFGEVVDVLGHGVPPRCVEVGAVSLRSRKQGSGWPGLAGALSLGVTNDVGGTTQAQGHRLGSLGDEGGMGTQGPLAGLGGAIEILQGVA